MKAAIEYANKAVRDPAKASGFLLKKTVVGRLFAKWFDLQATNVYTREWDVLLVLDSCRPDALEAVADEYEFLPEEIPEIVSVGGGSLPWMSNTFTEAFDDEIGQTTYVSGNPHTRRILGPTLEGAAAAQGGDNDRLSRFAEVVPVWEYGWDETLGTVPARPITDRVVHQRRTNESGRIIAHYMQPHFPSVPDTLGNGMDIEDDARWETDYVWTRFRDGEFPIERVWEAYLENLRYVLNDVALLLDNVDAETVVITADHGEAFREHNCTGHGEPFLTATRTVPWVVTSASDSGSYEPEIEERDGPRGIDVEDRLEALGYK